MAEVELHLTADVKPHDEPVVVLWDSQAIVPMRRVPDGFVASIPAVGYLYGLARAGLLHRHEYLLAPRTASAGCVKRDLLGRLRYVPTAAVVVHISLNVAFNRPFVHADAPIETPATVRVVGLDDEIVARVEADGRVHDLPSSRVTVKDLTDVYLTFYLETPSRTFSASVSGCQIQSPRGELHVPFADGLFAAPHFNVAGPFEGLPLELASLRFAWEPRFPAEVGHRGCGSQKSGATVRENTLLSFSRAHEAGVRFVEFDVLVTRDGEAVIHHDHLVKVTLKDGAVVDVPLCTLSADEFRAVGDVGRTTPPDAVLHDGFPSLRELLELLPEELGFDVEVKYPTDGFMAAHCFAYHPRTLVAQTVLALVHTHARKRKIFFSTFDPDLCAVLAAASALPVFYLTGWYGVPDADIDAGDVRCRSLDDASAYAAAAGVGGMVVETRRVLEDAEGTKLVKSRGLTLLTYGRDNVDVAKIILQRGGGVDGVIADDIERLLAHRDDPK
jgi:glycerophosphoryl diester phosphodiesterase